VKHNSIPVITIDGPSGSGKGTISIRVAKYLGWHFLDSGALYRVLAYYALQQKIVITDALKLEELALALPVEFKEKTSGQESDIILAGEVVTDLIRTETCGNVASKIAAIPSVRTALLSRQRAFLELPGLVADGRDMGTIIFPNALLKFFFRC
jgi:CMP/dCMP kinase